MCNMPTWIHWPFAVFNINTNISRTITQTTAQLNHNPIQLCLYPDVFFYLKNGAISRRVINGIRITLYDSNLGHSWPAKHCSHKNSLLLSMWQFYSSIYLVPDSLLRTQKLSPFLCGIFVGYSSSKDIVVFWSVVKNIEGNPSFTAHDCKKVIYHQELCDKLLRQPQKMTERNYVKSIHTYRCITIYNFDTYPG